MYVRVWEYEVEDTQLVAFVDAYGATGAWARLFARADGYAGTQLFSDVEQTNHFLTVDRWTDADCWHAFLNHWADEYTELDHQLRWLAAGGRPVVEGTTPGA